MNYTQSTNPGTENPRIIIILRGASGCGKSSFAESIKDLHPNAVVACADDYFMKDGEYQFDASKLGAAHGSCYRKFKEALDRKEKAIIVANTCTSPREWKEYEKEGKAAGYTVFFCVLENRHGGKDVHSVPEEILQKQEQNIKNSLKLR